MLPLLPNLSVLGLEQLGSFFQGGRVTNPDYKPFLEHIARNVNTLIANNNKASISNENPMTCDRISKALMNDDDRSATITMK